jgi:hypothetical protein
MLSHVEAMIKIWEGFAHIDTYDAYKPDISRTYPWMASTIIEELKKYTNFHLQMPSAANLLVLSYSNVIGLILE